jgi:voltage-gated potassium channel
MKMEDQINMLLTTGDPEGMRINTYTICMAVLALISFINFFLLIFVPLPAQIHVVLNLFDVLVALIFLADFFVRLVRVSKKWQYLRTWGWLDVLSGIPFPIFNLARVARFVRVVFIMRRMRRMRRQDVQSSITRHPAQSTLIGTGFLTFLVVVIGSAVVLHFEEFAPHATIVTGGDALWWAVVTLATVGYGDTYPITEGGRITATVLMAVGVVLIGVLSSFLASTFIASRQRDDREAIIATLQHDLNTLMADVAEIKQSLQQRDQTS